MFEVHAVLGFKTLCDFIQLFLIPSKTLLLPFMRLKDMLELGEPTGKKERNRVFFVLLGVNIWKSTRRVASMALKLFSGKEKVPSFVLACLDDSSVQSEEYRLASKHLSRKVRAVNDLQDFQIMCV